MEKSAIFIFTNDNSKLLNELSNLLLPLINDFSFHFVDDSFNLLEQKRNRQIAERYSEKSYLGVDEFKKNYLKSNLETNLGSYSIGNANWNLGNARNFALDYSIENQYSKVLFIDHDINQINITQIKNGFDVVDKNTFVGFTLTGLKDDSIIGHLATKYCVNDTQEKLISGGFMFFTPNTTSNNFVNIYNEDWIFQLMERNKKRVILPYTVNHQKLMEMEINLEKLIFQETGELIVDGLFEDKEACNNDDLFWSRIIEERRLYVENIKSISKNKGDKDVFNYLSLLLTEYESVKQNLKNILTNQKWKKG